MAECLLAMPAQLMGTALTTTDRSESYTFSKSWSYSRNTSSQTGFVTVCTVDCTGAMLCKVHLPTITLSGTSTCTKSALESRVSNPQYKIINGDESFTGPSSSDSVSKTGSIGACSLRCSAFDVQFTPQGSTFIIQISVSCYIESSDSSGTKRTDFTVENQIGSYDLSMVIF